MCRQRERERESNIFRTINSFKIFLISKSNIIKNAKCNQVHRGIQERQLRRRRKQKKKIIKTNH
jgi:hypothetical protein